MDRLNLSGSDGAVRLAVRVVPRSGRNVVDSVSDTGALRVRLAAPPVEGAANAALIALLADLLAIPKGDISIYRGQHGRDKIVQIAAPLSSIRERLRVARERSPRE